MSYWPWRHLVAVVSSIAVLSLAITVWIVAGMHNATASNVADSEARAAIAEACAVEGATPAEVGACVLVSLTENQP